MADTSTLQSTFDALSAYASTDPGYTEELKEKIDSAGLGNTDVGKAMKAGAEGAAAGIASGAGVGAAVAGTAVGVGILTTGAVAAQAIPVIGTVIGAVLGLCAGLVAFFTGKSAAEKKKNKELGEAWRKTLDDLGLRVRTAISFLPASMRDRALQLLKSRIDAAVSGHPATTQGYAEMNDAIIEAVSGFPRALADSVIQWTAEDEKLSTQAQAAPTASAFLTPRRVGYAIVGAGLLTGLYLAHQRKMI